MVESQEISKENINSFSCDSCGADMIFDPSIQELQCTYCENSQLIRHEGSVEENSYIEHLEKGSRKLQPMALMAMQVDCNSCGAIINFTPPQTTEDCDFCGAEIVAQSKASDPLIAPNGVLPLLITPERAKSEFREWVSTLWFAPRKLKSLAREEEKRSIYIPFWTYDANSESYYTGQRGDYYYVTETYTQNGKNKNPTSQKNSLGKC